MITYFNCIIPVLKAISDGREWSKKDIYEPVAKIMGLTEEEKSERIPSGPLKYQNTIEWSFLYLTKSGLVVKTKPAFVMITEEGRKLLKENPAKIDNNFLIERYPKYREWVSSYTQREQQKDDGKRETLEGFDTCRSVTPEEEIDRACRDLRENLTDELLETVKRVDPSFFEKLVIDLLLKMGYGGSRAEAGRAVGKTGDGGIDGIIDEDKLGLDKIYIQAKRWENTVGRPIVQAFVGSLAGNHSKKGIFITTSDFTKDAREYIEKIDSRISLVDGRKLVELMIDHGLGVSTSNTYEIKKVDRDYFPEDLF